MIAGQGRRRAAAQRAVQVGVIQVASEVDALVIVHLIPRKISTTRRPGDKVIVHDVVIERGAGVRGIARRIIVFDVVDENRVDLGQRIAVVRIGENVVEPGPLATHRFGMTTKLLASRVGDDRILHSDRRHQMGAITHSINVVPRRKFDRGMIHDDVLCLIKT